MLIGNDYDFDTFKMERNLLSTTLAEARLGKFDKNPKAIHDVLDSVRIHSHIIRAAEGNPVIPLLMSFPGINLLHEMILNRLNDFDDEDIDELDDHEYTEMMSLATLADIADKSFSQETLFISCLFYRNKPGSVSIKTPLRLLLNIGFKLKLFPEGTFITNGMIYVKVVHSVTYGKLIVLHVDPDQYMSSQTNNFGLKLRIPEDHHVVVMGIVSPETIAEWVTGESSQPSMNIGARMKRNLWSDKDKWFGNQCGPMVYGYQKLRVRERTLWQSVSYLEVKSRRILNKTAQAKVTWLRGVKVLKSPEIFWSSQREWSEADSEAICSLSAVQKIISRALRIQMKDAEDYASFFLLANNWFNPSGGAVNKTDGCAYLHKDKVGVEVKPVSWKVCEAIGWSHDSSREKILTPTFEGYSVICRTSQNLRGHFDVEKKEAKVPHYVVSSMKFAGNSKSSDLT